MSMTALREPATNSLFKRNSARSGTGRLRVVSAASVKSVYVALDSGAKVLTSNRYVVPDSETWNIADVRNVSTSTGNVSS